MVADYQPVPLRPHAYKAHPQERRRLHRKAATSILRQKLLPGLLIPTELDIRPRKRNLAGDHLHRLRQPTMAETGPQIGMTPQKTLKRSP